MDLEINLKKGIGKLVFGLSIEGVIDEIGSPTDVEELGEDIDQPTTILHYDQLGLSLFFDISTCSKLSCIDLDCNNAVLFGKKIIGSGSKDIEELMKKNKISNITKEKEDWGEMRISFEDYSIDFYFIDDELVSVTFGE